MTDEIDEFNQLLGRLRDVVDLLRQLEHARDADRVEVLASWGSGKARILYVATLKFEFWDKIPHRLCGLAHPDPRVAAQTAEDCLRQFEVLPRDDLAPLIVIRASC